MQGGWSDGFLDFFSSSFFFNYLLIFYQQIFFVDPNSLEVERTLIVRWEGGQGREGGQGEGILSFFHFSS